ncbi:hypothetical protein LY76DRAFT_148478 [Colletotrichum caudatum]|nr:hypothetical protein LY76DRAFT_148478 [Colletotrichum caudatum]
MCTALRPHFPRGNRPRWQSQLRTLGRNISELLECSFRVSYSGGLKMSDDTGSCCQAAADDGCVTPRCGQFYLGCSRCGVPMSHAVVPPSLPTDIYSNLHMVATPRSTVIYFPASFAPATNGSVVVMRRCQQWCAESAIVSRGGLTLPQTSLKAAWRRRRLAQTSTKRWLHI